ncbi:MAG: 16S rRNA (cytidine(1402)-2'-O)-methyltransferase [Ignavibacteria bacterium]
MFGTLYIVSTHIGNIDDLTLRAKRILQECDIIICEELKPARQLLKSLNLYKELLPLNEHTEQNTTPIVIGLLKSGKNCCLISDAGTPIFSDPGNYLLNIVRQNDIQISLVPGPDSLIPSLVLSGFDISKFYFAGWLSPKSEERKSQLKKLKTIELTLALMETPYRLIQLLNDVSEIFGKETLISLACDLTTINEYVYRGKIDKIINDIKEMNLKCEFVLVIDNNKIRGIA